MKHLNNNNLIQYALGLLLGWGLLCRPSHG